MPDFHFKKLVVRPPLTPALSHCRNDLVQPRMDTDKHGFAEMIFVVSLQWQTHRLVVGLA
jgi:hypothetical protein